MPCESPTQPFQSLDEHFVGSYSSRCQREPLEQTICHLDSFLKSEFGPCRHQIAGFPPSLSGTHASTEINLDTTTVWPVSRKQRPRNAVDARAKAGYISKAWTLMPRFIEVSKTSLWLLLCLLLDGCTFPIRVSSRHCTAARIKGLWHYNTMTIAFVRCAISLSLHTWFS
jgi:hypothetical protein